MAGFGVGAGPSSGSHGEGVWPVDVTPCPMPPRVVVMPTGAWILRELTRSWARAAWDGVCFLFSGCEAPTQPLLPLPWALGAV